MHVLFRTDASTEIGTGHMMRCFALAQHIRDTGGDATLCTAEIPDVMREKFIREGIAVHELTSEPYGNDDVKETAQCAASADAEWIVVDGYRFDAAYQRTIKERGRSILWIDDYGHAREYCADIIVNQNAYANETPFIQRQASSRLLLGPRFALLRREFAVPRDDRDASPVARNILATLGGTDQANVTARVIDALATLDGIATTIVIGGANPNKTTLLERCVKTGMHAVIDSDDMRGLYARTDMAIAAGGTTSYELACMGVPIVHIVLSDNQRAVAETFANKGVCINLGWYEHIRAQEIASAVRSLAQDRRKRITMSTRGRELVDGYGVMRVRREMSGERIWLRKASLNDCGMLLQWANDPETRAMSFTSATIVDEDHKRWCLGKLNDPSCLLLIGINEQEEPVGQVRFDAEKNRATISVGTAKEHRGKGYGTALITQGCRTFFASGTMTDIDAYIKPENTASAAAFETSGFRRSETTQVRGQTAIRYTLRR